MVKLDNNILSHFNVHKLRLDASVLIERKVLYEIWGQKLNDILDDNSERERPPEHEIMKEVRETIQARHLQSMMDRMKIKESNIPL